SIDSKNSSTRNSNSDMKNLKKDEFSVKLSMAPVRKLDENLSSNGLQFDRLQPSDQELVRENRFEFGQFVAREAMLDEEYWTAAWLRAETHWENRTYERYDTKYIRNLRCSFIIKDSEE
ncbi:acyl-CoA N-acyltransferase (NAT) superfamily protein, partial [Trifolium medium]|nr:acyl-CoA N-acyltransferase (NAT) superfamily protein [Trifolium medium]